MIKVVDNFLAEHIYQYEKGRLIDSEFEKVVVGGKDFHIVSPDETFLNYVLGKLAVEMNSGIELILGFFRLATNEIDTDWRIHSDLNINGQRPTHAGVLYFSENQIITYQIGTDLSDKIILNSLNQELYGTAFWSHVEHGSRLHPETSDEDYNELLAVDANDISRWNIDSVVSAKENRLLLYEANLFHSKYPNTAWIDENGKGRMVLVLFFNKI